MSNIISVKVLFAFSIPSELFVNDVAGKVWTLAFISLLLNAALQASVKDLFQWNKLGSFFHL